jgi:hypothetical protein
MKPTSLSRLAALAVFIAGMLPGGDAAIVEFTIDSAQTQVTLSGKAAGITVAQQGPGSLTTSFEGTVLAEVAEDSIRFLGGSRIEGVINGEWSPLALGEEGTAPAEFGAQVSSFLASGTGALRDLLLDLESEAVPLTEGQFNADGLLFRFPEDAPSAFDYRVNVLLLGLQHARRELAGYATNQITATGTLTPSGNTEVLVIPIEATITFELLNPGDSSLTITGQLLATRELNGTAGIVIGSVRVEDGALVFEWTGGTAAPVQIELTTDLVNWNKVADIPAGVTTWSVATSDGMGLYRIAQ